MKNDKIKMVKRLDIITCTLMVLFSFSAVAFAAPDEPIKVLNNLTDLIFTVLRAVGVILLIWGMVQIALSLKSHDPSQRANSILFIGGAILVFAIQPIVNFLQS